MNEDSGKVIHSFNERLAIDQAVRALAEADNAFDLDRRARELAEKGEPALNALLRQLDTDNPTLRGGLGQLARHIDRENIVPALFRAAADARRSANARLTAIMLLERYLDEEVPPNLAGDLPSAAAVARASAQQAIALAANQPGVLVEYAQQLLAEPPEVIHAVVNVIAGLEDPGRARLLTAIAAYAAPRTTDRIGQILGASRDPAALAGLRLLRRLADPSLESAFARLARKLQLAGVRTTTTRITRALWSPVSAQGQSLLWLTGSGGSSNTLTLHSFVLHDAAGIIHSATQPSASAGDLPTPTAPGSVHLLRVPRSHQTLSMVEIEPGLGLSILTEATRTLRKAELPWPAELVVFGHWFWNDDANIQPPAWPDLPAADTAAPPEAFANLLHHPAFDAWAWDIPGVDDLLDDPDPNRLEALSPIHHHAARRMLHKDSGLRLQQRLQQQAHWLTLAGAAETAALALAARAAVAAEDVDHPFLLALAQRSLIAAAADRIVQRHLHIVS